MAAYNETAVGAMIQVLDRLRCRIVVPRVLEQEPPVDDLPPRRTRHMCDPRVVIVGEVVGDGGGQQLGEVTPPLGVPDPKPCVFQGELDMAMVRPAQPLSVVPVHGRLGAALCEGRLWCVLEVGGMKSHAFVANPRVCKVSRNDG